MWVVWLSVGAALVGLILLIDRLLKERIGKKLYRRSEVLRLPESELDVIIRQAILDKTSRLAVWAFEGLLNQQKNPSATWQFLFEELRKVPEGDAVAVLKKVLEKAESHHIG